MEQSNRSFLPKIMSILFIAMGIFLGIYAFFAHATSRDINGNTRDNANYINDDFRSYNPSDDDIITALYGSGDDGSIYTSGWNGYGQLTCLGDGMMTPPMTVERTGAIPTSPNARTIYVIESGSYDVTSIIDLPYCTAFISSGTVVLSGNFTMILPANPLLTTLNHENILQNIQIDANTDKSNGLLIEGYNVTLKDFHVYNNKQTDGYGILLSGSSYVNLVDVESYDNDNGLIGYAEDNIHAAGGRIINNNESGISGDFNRSTFSGMNIYNNNYGVFFSDTSRTTIEHFSIHNNTMGGIFMYGGDTNTITDSFIYNNTGFGISVEGASDIDINLCYLSGNLSTGIILSHNNNLTLDQLTLNDETVFADGGTGYIFTTLGGNSSFTMFDPVDLFFDIYTKENNHLTTNFSDLATLTGSTIASGSAFYMIAHELFVQDTDPTQGNDILLSGVSELLIGGDDRDGIIYRPIEITMGGKLGVVGEAGMENISQIVNTVEAASTGDTILTLSGGTATIYFQIPGFSSGYYLAIRQSTDGDNRSANTPDAGCFLDGDDKCVFTTEGTFKLFAFGVPTDYSFTGETQTGEIVSSGGVYYTGIQIYFTGTNLSGATLNGDTYNNGDLITADGDYTFILTDMGNNSTGMMFTIVDTTPPLFTGTTLSGTTVTSGGAYTTGIIIDFSDANLSGATLNDVPYTSGTLITDDGTYIFYVEDTLGNSGGMTFIIDTTPPVFTGITQGGTTVVSGGIYNTGITITFSDANLSGATLNGNAYASGTLITGDNTYVFYVEDILGNFTGMMFIIDTTPPVFTGITQGGTTVVSGGIYNTGITITFSDANLSGATLNGNAYASGILITGDATYVFYVEDILGNFTGMTFSIDTTNPIVTGISPASGLNFTGGNTIAFLWSGSDVNMSGYALSITGAGIYTISTVGTGYSITLVNGTYTRYVTATDRAGNTATSTPATFMITTPLSGNATITGTNIQYNGSQAYTKDYASLYLRTNQPTNYQVTGDIALGTMSGSISGGMIISPSLTGIDGAKNIYITFSTSGETIQKTISIYLDTIAPVPTLTSPASGATVTGAFTLARSIGTDAVGITGYRYFISTTGTFATLVKSGFVTSTSTGIADGALGGTGTFYRYIKALDKLGNSGTSIIQSFINSGITDTVPNTFSFTRVTSARLNRVYASNTVTITGLSANTPVLASINKGVLYISGTMVGTTGYIQNGRTVKIELISSDEYDDEVTSTLTIGGVSAIYRITTKTEEEANDGTNYDDISTDLSATAKLQIIAIFEALKDLYAGDKEVEFFNTLMVMLQSRMDDFDQNDSEYDALKYLYDLADQYDGQGGTNTDISNTSRIVNGVYTAPNGKRYTITYDSAKRQFTSSNFVTPKYFPTLDVLRYTIDINNPVGSAYADAKPIKARRGRIALDGTRQTSPYTAPNRKVFYFFKTMEGRYSSYTFTVEKYFDSLEAVKEYIYNNNKR